MGFNQVFGYYIEITHTHCDRVLPDYVRKQTIKNASLLTDELKQHETEVPLPGRANLLEADLLSVSAATRPSSSRAQALALAVAEIDVVAGWAWLADERATSAESPLNPFGIVDGRHRYSNRRSPRSSCQ